MSIESPSKFESKSGVANWPGVTSRSSEVNSGQARDQSVIEGGRSQLNYLPIEYWLHLRIYIVVTGSKIPGCARWFVAEPDHFSSAVGQPVYSLFLMGSSENNSRACYLLVLELVPRSYILSCCCAIRDGTRQDETELDKSRTGRGRN